MTVDESKRRARQLVGARVEIPAHYDAWMQGARFGKVTSWRNASASGLSAYVLVKLDVRLARKSERLRIWALDFDYIREIGEGE